MGQILIRHLAFELAMMVTGGDRLAALQALATQNLDLVDLSQQGTPYVSRVNYYCRSHSSLSLINKSD